MVNEYRHHRQGPERLDVFAHALVLQSAPRVSIVEMNSEFPDFDILEKLTKQIVDLSDIKPTPIVLVDGPACSGKTTFARALQDALFTQLEVLPKLVHMDDLYPGWDGLRAGSNYLIQSIVQPIRQGKSASWQIWDWAHGLRGNPLEEGNGWRAFDGGTPLIVEGCGAISRVSSELADLKIWISADETIRKERWRVRDAGKFDEYWGIWQAQEDEFYESEKSAQLADFQIQH